MTFGVRVSGLEAGRVAMAVGRPRTSNGKTTLRIRGKGETVPFISTFHRMKEEIITQLDLGGLLPVRTSSKRRVPDKQRDVVTTFGSQILQAVQRPRRKYKRRRRIREPCYDPISTLYLLRSMPLRKGRKLSFLMLSGTALHRIELQVQAKERVYSRVGPRDAWRISGVALRVTDSGKRFKSRPARKTTIWISADRQRLPLMLVGETKLGLVEAEITSYRAPRAGLRVRVARLSR